MLKRFLLALVVLALAVPPAYAGMIRPVEGERERVRALLERSDVRAELQKHGVLADQAAARVDVMTSAEVHELAGRIDSLAAGGATNETLLLLIVLVLLIAILV